MIDVVGPCEGQHRPASESETIAPPGIGHKRLTVQVVPNAVEFNGHSVHGIGKVDLGEEFSVGRADSELKAGAGESGIN